MECIAIHRQCFCRFDQLRARFRLLALDIDGTLLRTDKTLSPRVKRAVLAARERGVHVVLVTGGSYM